jgi:predicted MFS family arabinose efflux permease
VRLLRQRDFGLFWLSVALRILPAQMIGVLVGWQVYAISGDPFDIGLVGLAEFAPLPLIALPTGQLADRISRRFVLALALVVAIVDATLLLVVTARGGGSVWPFVALAALGSVAYGLGQPSARAMVPELVPAADVSAATALRTIATQTGIVAGPALGGLLFAVRPWLAYAVALVFFCVALGCLAGVRPRPRPASTEPPGLAHLLGGIHFVRRTPIVGGAILLDLFAVLFGSGLALLPVFAQDVLHVGPEGLGVLRSAPAAGALVAGWLLVRRPIRRAAGSTMLAAVALFGVSFAAFGLSRWYVVSLLALGVSGFADMISMNVRSTALALATPNRLRGRVSAVENVFITGANQLGAFEAGAAAALLGAVPAVVAGGIATIGVALAWTRLFPALARVDRLETLVPEPTADEVDRLTPATTV